MVKATRDDHHGYTKLAGPQASLHTCAKAWHFVASTPLSIDLVRLSKAYMPSSLDMSIYPLLGLKGVLLLVKLNSSIFMGNMEGNLLGLRQADLSGIKRFCACVRLCRCHLRSTRTMIRIYARA